MYIEADTLDDVLRKAFRRIIKDGTRVNPRKGDNKELVGVLLKIKNPRARFSRAENRATLFSCLGETLWYLSGSDRLDVIEYYIKSYRKFSKLSKRATKSDGAYGPRLFGAAYGNQVRHTIDRLNERSATRQAVIQLFDRTDVQKSRKDVPCTCTLQFLGRGGELHLHAHMRSNDAFRGLPHDVFAFTMLQELVARSTNHEVGTYSHSVGSLHLYDKDFSKAKQYLSEGWQENIAMPPMPLGDPWAALALVLEAEAAIRLGLSEPGSVSTLDPYWLDLVRLLRIKALLDKHDGRSAVREKNAMSSSVYDTYIRGRERDHALRNTAPQLNLPGITPAADKS
jgi:thymidylate synthase